MQKILKKKELYIVEGKSAETALMQCIDKNQQSVHALQGKLLNVHKHNRDTVLANLECQQLIATLGCGFEETYDANSMTYSGVLIVMDPDIDGVHSSSLVLSFFALYYKALVESGRLFIIKPPMFRVTSQAQKHWYAWSEQDRLDVLDANDGTEILTTTRFKGIAQLSCQECDHFIVSPQSRKQFVLTNR